MVKLYFFLTVLAPTVCGQTLVIPQIVDGGGWQTTIVLTNTSASTDSASLSFFQDMGGGATQSWNLALLEATPTQSLSLPAGSSLFLHTPGTDNSTSSGWAQIQADSSIVSYAILTNSVSGQPNQVSTVNAAAPASRALVPFDNTNGAVTNIAIANPTASTETILAGINAPSGTVSQLTPISLTAQGHMAFQLDQQYSAAGGQSGLIEFYSPTGDISVLALRADGSGALAASPVYSQIGPPIIASPSSGGSALPQFRFVDINVSPATAGQIGLATVGIFAAPGAGYIQGSCGGGGVFSATGTFVHFTATWNSVTVSGQTFTFSGLDPNMSVMQSATEAAAITSGSLTVTLNPQGAPTVGTVSGSFTLTSSIATFNGSFTGTYTAALLTSEAQEQRAVSRDREAPSNAKYKKGR